MELKVINRSHHPLPEYATPLSAGLDLRANLSAPVTLQPLGRALIPTGLFIALPPGFEAQVRPRSGLALKKGIGVLNSPGTMTRTIAARLASFWSISLTSLLWCKTESASPKWWWRGTSAWNGQPWTNSTRRNAAQAASATRANDGHPKTIRQPSDEIVKDNVFVDKPSLW